MSIIRQGCWAPPGVEVIFLLQTSASLFADGYCADVSRRISAAAGVPGFTSAMAIGEAVNALGTRRIALVSPYSVPVNASAKRYFEGKYGLSVVALEGFAATDSYAIGQLGPIDRRDLWAVRWTCRPNGRVGARGAKGRCDPMQERDVVRRVHVWRNGP